MNWTMMKGKILRGFWHGLVHLPRFRSSNKNWCLKMITLKAGRGVNERIGLIG